MLFARSSSVWRVRGSSGQRLPWHHEIGAANAVEHRPGIDQRCAIDHQGFCLVQLALLVQDPCNQLVGKTRHRLRTDILLGNAQPSR